MKAALDRFTALDEKKCKQTVDQKCKQRAEDTSNSFELDKSNFELTQPQVFPPNEESKQTVEKIFFTPLSTPAPPKRSKQTAEDVDKIEVEAQVHTPNVQKMMKNIGKFGNTVVTKSRYYCIFIHQFFLQPILFF